MTTVADTQRRVYIKQAEKTKDEALREIARLKKVLKVQRRDMAMKESSSSG